MNRITRAWIEAGKLIAADINARVNCPVCAAAKLEVLDIQRKDSPESWERRMRCPACGSSNFILMKNAATSEDDRVT